ncbi:MAG: DUF481 domain-containing protein [Sedimentisphaerales bacterium]|nr:DUF481 domain-containing protein [Sedimentisphaerales bacterium]
MLGLAKRGWVAVGCWFLFLGVAAAGADELVLNNGDVLHGQVVSIEGGNCNFNSAILGQLQISLEQITTIATDANMPVRLADEQEAINVWISPAEDGVCLDDGVSECVVPLSSVAHAGPPALVPWEELDADPWVWSGNAELGFRARRGNSERASLETNARLGTRNSVWALSGHFRSYYAEQEVDGRDEPTDDELRGGVRTERILFDGLSAYLALDLERDRIEDLRLRSTWDGGFCYLVWDSDTVSWKLCGGLGQEDERYYDGRSESSCIGTLQSYFTWQIVKRVEFTQQTEWLSNLATTADYRINAETAAVVHLDDAEHFFIKIGLRHEYDNAPAADVERLDSYFFSSIGASF